MRHVAPIIAPIAIVMSISACSEQAQYHKLEGKTMGTSYHITFGSKQTVGKAVIQADIDKHLELINQSMSTYIKDSTISKFNQLPANQTIEIDTHFAKVLADSRTIYTHSQGSFDPTVYPLVELWGFGSKMSVERLQSPPTDAQIHATKTKVGLDKVVDDKTSIYKTQDGVGLDFSAIAKGYGVDIIAQVLSQHGINDYMVEIGGEVATKGVNAQGKPWTLAIDAPITDSTTTNRQAIATLTQKSGETLHIATSGGYRNSVVFDGVRYSHTINAATGKPVANSAASVTVLHDSVSLADGWATALTAISQDDALKMANDNGILALFVITDKSNQDFKIIKSQAMIDKYGQ